MSQTCLAEITLSANTDLSSEGYFVLNWASDSDQDVRLQSSTSANFSAFNETELPLSGSITITGLVDGQYYYRIADGTEQSNVVTVNVAHHSLMRALGFFSLGLVLFIILLGTILIGNRRVPTL